MCSRIYAPSCRNCFATPARTSWTQTFWVGVETIEGPPPYEGVNSYCDYLSAMVFGRIFFRDPPRRRADDEVDTREMQAADKKKCKFVYHFIMDDKSDFVFGR